MRVLIVDNKDSFTFNVAQLVGALAGEAPLVISNTEPAWRQVLRDAAVGAVIISPGPGTPARRSDFGICKEVIREAAVPVLGICLGHQGIGLAHGAKVVAAPKPMHGRSSRVTHGGGPLFERVPRSFDAVRYHSLCLDKAALPSCLAVTAWSDDGVPMAISHVSVPHFGLQFHPESVGTEQGSRMLGNFLRVARLAAAPGRSGQAADRRPSARARSRRQARPPSLAARTLDRWVEPLEAFERLFAHQEYAYWLDSSLTSPGASRFSLMGDASGPHSAALLYRTRDRTLRVLRGGRWRRHRVSSLVEELRGRLDRHAAVEPRLSPGFRTGLVGFFGYEMRGEFGALSSRGAEGPDAAFFDAGRCLVFDHRLRQVRLVARTGRDRSDATRWFDTVERRLRRRPPALTPASRSGPLEVTLADGHLQYGRKIRRCLKHLGRGESYQICLSTEFTAPCSAPAFDVYRTLRSLNPAPYSAYLRFGKLAILSSSPERFLKVAADRAVSARPIKGTCARGANPQEDGALAHRLRTQEKFRSENLTIVDLLRNDIGRVAALGSVRVPHLMEVESYATLHQLVSTVEGRLPRERDCLDCLAAAFPGGSMTGAPKLRTMAIIDSLEGRARGAYAGAIGYLSHGDTMDLSIVIRTIVLRGDRASVASGGGIVAMSDPEEEFEEMLLKARAPLQALAAAATGNRHAWRLRYGTP